MARDDWGDVIYETWRRGGNPDRLDYNDVSDDLLDGYTADEIAEAECRRQDRAQREAQREYEEEFPS